MNIYEITSPYFILHDGLQDLEEAAALAGEIKNINDELFELTSSFSKLTTINTLYQEERARKLLELLITAKRSYIATETKQLVEKPYE